MKDKRHLQDPEKQGQQNDYDKDEVDNRRPQVAATLWHSQQVNP